jgi:hypothetical protein
MPGALVSARRRDPGRRRVQAAGVVLLSIGLLFLLSATLSLVLPQRDADSSLAEALAHQQGGRLLVDFPQATSSNLTITTFDGAAVANASVTDGHYTLDKAPFAVLRINATQGNVTWSRTAIVVAGDSLQVALPAGGDAAPASLVVGPTLRTAVSAGRWVFVVLAALLVGGGLCATLLRAWPIAVLAAVVGALLGLLAVVGFLLLGVLFAAPFAFCAYVILRGRNHFRTP